MLGIVNFSKEKFPKFQGRVILSTENFLNFVTLPQERNCSVMNITELWKIYTPVSCSCWGPFFMDHPVKADKNVIQHEN